ncbi:Uncharacterized protein PECH_004976 [Penicillium ucsense]|uniref:Uncharacterized protein n=1 Tax=Penicillium ucsense TaxID=2839758 RepID=A0A8J8VYB1_9EURO|nr:Uncharacterized protein PECM_008863 [Penicillium ucsense]KAF7736761.1 Uncharacterized protein PECH_004976 [Penicillium ucsense]
MTLSDMEMDRDWKPTGKVRPQSTMAQAFSSALDSAFMLDSDVNHLSLTIDQKKQQMAIQTRELENLQARIREAEERLKAQSHHSVSASSAGRTPGDHDRPSDSREQSGRSVHQYNESAQASRS